jgi:hypothetical protein
MMTHDPFQNYQAFGAFPGQPYTAFQPFVNPSAIGGQTQTIPGITGYPGYPQQAFQGAGLQGIGIPGQQNYGQQGYGQPFGQPLQTLNPLTASLQNPLVQNPLVQNALLQNALIQNALLQSQLQQNPFLQNPQQQYPQLQNPLLQHSLAQGPWQNPMLAYHTWPQQQQQFNYPLAPQSLIGQPGIGQPFGQIHPLAHAAALRQATAYAYPTGAGCY